VKLSEFIKPETLFSFGSSTPCQVTFKIQEGRKERKRKKDRQKERNCADTFMRLYGVIGGPTTYASRRQVLMEISEVR
jgi:hypothetical protein